FAGDGAVGRARVEEAGQAVGAGPMHGHVAVVPTDRVGASGRRAAEGGRGLVYIDGAYGGRGRIARIVTGRAGDGLVRAIVAERGRAGAGRDARATDIVSAGEADGHVGFVPAEGVGPRGAAAGDRRGGGIGVAVVEGTGDVRSCRQRDGRGRVAV